MKKSLTGKRTLGLILILVSFIVLGLSFTQLQSALYQENTLSYNPYETIEFAQQGGTIKHQGESFSVTNPTFTGGAVNPFGTGRLNPTGATCPLQDDPILLQKSNNDIFEWKGIEAKDIFDTDIDKFVKIKYLNKKYNGGAKLHVWLSMQDAFENEINVVDLTQNIGLKSSNEIQEIKISIPNNLKKGNYILNYALTHSGLCCTTLGRYYREQVCTRFGYMSLAPTRKEVFAVNPAPIWTGITSIGCRYGYVPYEGDSLLCVSNSWKGIGCSKTGCPTTIFIESNGKVTEYGYTCTTADVCGEVVYKRESDKSKCLDLGLIWSEDISACVSPFIDYECNYKTQDISNCIRACPDQLVKCSTENKCEYLSKCTASSIELPEGTTPIDEALEKTPLITETAKEQNTGINSLFVFIAGLIFIIGLILTIRE